MTHEEQMKKLMEELELKHKQDWGWFDELPVKTVITVGKSSFVKIKPPTEYAGNLLNLSTLDIEYVTNLWYPGSPDGKPRVHGLLTKLYAEWNQNKES